MNELKLKSANYFEYNQRCEKICFDIRKQQICGLINAFTNPLLEDNILSCHIFISIYLLVYVAY